MVVSGWRFAVASVTNRPVMALLLPVAPENFLEWVTVVRGCRAAVALLTNLPVFALREAMVWLLSALWWASCEHPMAV